MRRPSTPCDHLDPTVLLLRRSLLRAAAPLLLALPACGEESTGEQLAPHCVEGVWVPTSNLSLPQEVAYASLRVWRSDLEIPSASGVPCEGATNGRLCMAEIDRVSAHDIDPAAGSFLLTSDGDTVEAFQTLTEKLSLLGAIDTPDEALIMAYDQYGEDLGCDTDVTRHADSSYTLSIQSSFGCEGIVRIRARVGADGKVVEEGRDVLSEDDCVAGRRPPGLLAAVRGTRSRSALGRHFARASRLERASVDAFEILERELVARGLPRGLRDALREAADDEVRHASDTARLAERFGERPEPVAMQRTAARSLAEIALDNAVEGCTRETYGAYLAQLQAGHARDPEMRRVLMAIAREETRHAALSWQLAAFLEPQLDTATRTRISSARRAAIARLGSRTA